MREMLEGVSHGRKPTLRRLRSRSHDDITRLAPLQEDSSDSSKPVISLPSGTARLPSLPEIKHSKMKTKSPHPRKGTAVFMAPLSEVRANRPSLRRLRSRSLDSECDLKDESEPHVGTTSRRSTHKRCRKGVLANPHLRTCVCLLSPALRLLRGGKLLLH
jgi:hypothetical protein